MAMWVQKSYLQFLRPNSYAAMKAWNSEQSSGLAFARCLWSIELNKYIECSGPIYAQYNFHNIEIFIQPLI
jgi:hypothetical protein